MFIHTGNGRIVFHRELIGIFNHNHLSINQNETNKQIWFPKDQLPKAGKGRSQSIVLTDREIYAAPISPLTLAGRSLK